MVLFRAFKTHSAIQSSKRAGCLRREKGQSLDRSVGRSDISSRQYFAIPVLASSAYIHKEVSGLGGRCYFVASWPIQRHPCQLVEVVNPVATAESETERD